MSAAAAPPAGAALRRDAEALAGALPPLLAAAERLAATVVMGFHGRRRAGMGENFWQYRQAVPGDPLALVDWRRSARSDYQFIRQMEWEAAQTVSLWVDRSQSMDYRGRRGTDTKRGRASLIALALAVLLVRAGERVALLDTVAEPPRAGRAQLNRIATELARNPDPRADYGLPPRADLSRGGRAVFLSDFLGPEEPLIAAIARAADQGVRGNLIQVLDPTETDFPFDGRLRFQSMAGAIDFETSRARGLRAAYLDRLKARHDLLQATAARIGWRYMMHRTTDAPRVALLWLYMAIGEGA